MLGLKERLPRAKGDFWWASHIQLPRQHHWNPQGMHAQTDTYTHSPTHTLTCKTPTAGGSYRRGGAAKFHSSAPAGSPAMEFMNIISMCWYVPYDINMDSNMETPSRFHPLRRALLMHSEKLLPDLHGLFWWARKDPLMCWGLLVHFKAVLKILCSVAGVSSCLISPPTNFNNDTVPHQHAKHVEPTNPSSFETQHPGINAFRLFFSTLFFFPLPPTQVNNFNISSFLKTRGLKGQWEITPHQTLLWNRFGGTVLIIQDSSFLLITWWNGPEPRFFLIEADKSQISVWCEITCATRGKMALVWLIHPQYKHI